ncbi:MAG: ABC transporter ATP-binding protein [Prolixibacteraceae bacterium]|jgi:putative ABC transport system ATP-binding protein|nr:ABC transporter ATP-binding protein [Prolixibacteraceae bacterium]MDD4756585.1 ABC transporter ATP-binding protein [Prolixibacteraceae bacterium]
MALVELQNVSKTYLMGEVSVQALKDVELEINEQTFVSFVGPSGSGKTTLLNLIGCLDKPTSGEISVDNTLVNHFNSKEAALFRGKHLGFIFQNFNLLSVLTAYENVEYPLIMVQNVPAEKRRERVLYYLNAVGMADQKDKFPSQLSGGQKQRVAVARALVADPKLVLADEPTANLDHVSAYKVIELMRKMQNELKTTFIFSTHDPKIVKEAEIVYSLEDGKIVNKQIN